MPEPTLSLPDAERLAERLILRIDIQRELDPPNAQLRYQSDRDQVESDLADLRFHAQQHIACEVRPCADAQDRSDNLRRTGRLYGVEL